MKTLISLAASAALVLSLQAGSATADTSVVRVGYSPRWYPYEFTSPDGAPDGFNIAMLNEIAKVEGLQMEYKAVTRSEISNELAEGKIDIIPSLFADVADSSPGFRAKLSISRPFITYTYSIFVRTDDRSIYSEKDLTGKTILVIEDGNVALFLKMRSISCTIVEAKDGPSLFRRLAAGEGDCAIYLDEAGQLVMRDNGIENISSSGPNLLSIPCGFAVAENNEELLAKLNEGLGIIKGNGRFRELGDRWFVERRETNLAWRRMAVHAISAIAVLLAAFAVTLMWSWTLRRKIAERTAEIDNSRKMIRELYLHMQRAIEDERKTVAREIHDALGQTLTALKLNLIGLLKPLPADMASVREKSESALRLTDAALADVRFISQRLRPSILDDLGLEAALEWLTSEMEKSSGIMIDFHVSLDFGDPEPEVATAIFRICQEALANIARHAQATCATVRLEQNDLELILEVGDNGKGLVDSDLTKVHSHGIRGMRERAEGCGGRMNLTSSNGKGTTIRIAVPGKKV